MSSRSRRRRSNNQLVIVVVVVAVALAALIIFLTLSSGQGAITSDETFFEGMHQEIVDEPSVGVAIGDPDAPVTMLDFSDFSCPHCARLAPAMHQVLDTYVRDGSVRVIYKPIIFVNPQTSTPAGGALLCAAQQGKGWQMHDRIWNVYGRAGIQGYNLTILSNEAETMGLDNAIFESCLSDEATFSSLQAVLVEAESRGVTGTPTIFVNDQQVRFLTEDYFPPMQEAIDAALAES